MTGAPARTRRLAAAAVALAIAACTGPAPAATTDAPATPQAAPTASADAKPAVALLAAACDAPAPAQFSGRPAAQGFTGYRTCRGRVRVEGAVALALDVWVDGLDASGAARSSCRQEVAPRAVPGSELPWTATCPVTPADAGFAVRFTDRDGIPVATRDLRPR